MTESALDGSRVLVTGAAGFIGSSLVDRLLDSGASVTGVDSFEDYYDRRLKERNLQRAQTHPRFTLLETNILTLAGESEEGAELRANVRGADVVYHLAAQAGVRASWGQSFRVYAENNVLGTQLMLEACKGSGVSRFVYASSSSVYGDAAELPLREDGVCHPISPYGVTKLAGEHLAVLYAASQHVPTVSLRFFTVYGPRQRPDMAFHIFIRALLNDEPIAVYGDGDQTRDFTYISDIVDALLLAPAAPGGSVVNLGGGARVSLREVLDVLGDVAGRSPRLQPRPTQAGDVRHTWADLRRARELLGYEPRVTLDGGLAAELAWLSGILAQEAEATVG